MAPGSRGQNGIDQEILPRSVGCHGELETSVSNAVTYVVRVKTLFTSRTILPCIFRFESCPSSYRTVQRHAKLSAKRAALWRKFASPLRRPKWHTGFC